jgi:hypothetical protein
MPTSFAACATARRRRNVVNMADYREVRYEHLYVKVPNGETLRATAAGRLKRLISDGWRETERAQTPDYIKVRLERSGHAPLMKHLPPIPPQQGRPPRDGMSRGFGGRGGPRGGGPRGGGRGGPGGPGGSPAGGAGPGGGAPRPGAGPRP